MEHTAGSEGRGELSGTLRGSFRSVLLGWTDPISGERLTVRMRGEGGLLDSLAPLGFEVLDGEAAVRPPQAPRKGRVWSFRAQRPRRVTSLRSRLGGRPEGAGGSSAAG